jgi:uncharacterized protein YndB with AHSA1/START domain
MLETSNSVIAAVQEPTADRELVFSRLFDAPREMVFQAWADPEQIVQWWGPKGFTTTTQKFDLRPGGVWNHIMHGPDGREYPNKSVFTEVVRPERIAYTHGGGTKGSAGVTFHMTVTFEAEGNKTRLTMHLVFPASADRDFAVSEYHADEGGKQTLERLAEHVATRLSLPGAAADYTLHITRMFDAPRELVFKAFTDPAMVVEWMGPRGFQAMDVAYDVRPGGTWRNRLHRVDDETACDSQGALDLWMHGRYIEVAPPERLVYTFSWEGRVDMQCYETTITATFRELEGKTVLDFKQGPFATVADRDGHNVGWSSAFDRFAEFLLAPVGAEKIHELVIERTFDAPRELVWKVWTDPDLAVEWAGPRGFRATHFEQDVRVGGKWRVCMHSDGFDAGDGVLRERNLWRGGVFRQIDPPELLVYTFAWDNPADIGLDLAPHETLVTVRFEEDGNKTKMTFHQEFLLTAGERDGHMGGWNSAFDKFAELLQQKVSVA